MATLDQARFPDGVIRHHLDFEKALVQLSTRFINVPPGNVDREIEDTLRRVCELFSIDLAVVWQWSPVAPGVAIPTHMCCVDEGWRPPEPMNQNHFPWAESQMLAGCMVVVTSMDDLPEEVAIDRESCRLFGIKSVLCLPLSVGGAPPLGALGLTTLREERDWPEALVRRLQLVADVFANALSRKRADDSLRANEARLSAAADLVGLAFYELDLVEGTAYLDARLRDLCGVPPEQAAGLDAYEFWIQHLHPDDRARVLEARRQLHEGEQDQLFMEYRYMDPAGGEKWIQHLAAVRVRDAAGRSAHSFGVLRDITERKQAEDELRDLSRRLIGAHEEERALLARELHDDVMQRLAVLAIDMGRAEHATQEGSRKKMVAAVRDGLVRISEDIHSLAYQLHPSILHELGLAEALRAECERVARRGSVEVAMSVEPISSTPGKDVSLCLFRVAQEALHNIVRHAGASVANVTLRQVDGGLLLAVRDDGCGFDPDRHGKGRHLGLASMRERVRLVNGSLDIDTAPGRGTAVVVWVPAEAGQP